jgi:hypothetical protein
VLGDNPAQDAGDAVQLIRRDALAHLLAVAGTTGFSIYPAEVGMSAQDWQAYGRAITGLHIARPVA